MILEKAKQYLKCDGAIKVIDYLNGQTDPDAIMTGYKELVQYTYWELKDLNATVQLAEAGIVWCLEYADQSLENNESESAQARKNAKVLAYNLGSFCWPGWDEPGIDITEVELEVGLHAAEQNLALAKQLQLGDLPMARALWLLAAHKLTRQNYTEAAQLFEDSANDSKAAGNNTESQMTEGFAQLAKILDPSKDRAKEQKRLNEIKQCLQTVKDGQEYLGQLNTASKVCERIANRY